eukprot:g6814.t1
MTLRPVQVTDVAVKVTLPPTLGLSAYSVRVCAASAAGNADCSNTLRVNYAQLWWTLGDAGNASTAGGWVRLFGTCLDFSGYGGAVAPGSAGTAVQLRERLQHALRSRDAPAIEALASKLAALMAATPPHTTDTHATAMTGAGVPGPQLRLSRGNETVLLARSNSSLWDALFQLPARLSPGRWSLSYRNGLQPGWTMLDAYGGRPQPHVRDIDVVRAPSAGGRVFTVNTYLERLGIAAAGLNFSTGAPINGTAAVHAALRDAERASSAWRPGAENNVVLLPAGRLFVDGALRVPPHTTLRGAAQHLTTVYFLEDGIGRQLGGLTVEQGGSPAPDPAYVFCNCTEPWGIEHLSLYVTHFDNTVVWVAPGAVGFRMRHVLVREVPYFCGGYGNIVPGGGNGVGGGAVPSPGARDKATEAALRGHANRIFNWTAGANNIGAMIFFEGNSNAEITDCDLTCTSWCIAVRSNPTYFPLGGDLPLVKRDDPLGPHHIWIARNVLHNADVGISLEGASRTVIEHNELRGSTLGGGAIYPSSAGHVYVAHNSNENHWSGDRESMTYDGNGGGAYYGPVARAEAGSTKVALPAAAAGGGGGGGEALIVLNGTGFGQIHAIAGYDTATGTYTLTTPLLTSLEPGQSWVQACSFQGRNIFHGNAFHDNGAFQVWGNRFESVFAANVGRRMGGFMAWGQHYGNASDTRLDPKGTVTSVGPNTRQLWLENEVLDENGVRNYMASARHTAQGARLRNASTGASGAPAQQSVDVMGSFQFNGFSFGVEGSSLADRPSDAPPLDSFLVWRRNRVGASGGFGLGVDRAITPGVKAAVARQPPLAEVLLEGNSVEEPSSVPFDVVPGASGL